MLLQLAQKLLRMDNTLYSLESKPWMDKAEYGIQEIG